MRVLSYRVPKEWDGAMVKAFARGYLGFSARVLAGQKREGGILLNDRPCLVTQTLSAGDILSFPLLSEPMDYPPADLPLSVLYEDEDFLIVDKPAGMPVHPSPGHDRDSLLNAAAHYYERTGQSHRIRPLYRLDKDTTGLIVLGKHRAAAGAETHKRYLAVCEGELWGKGTVDLPIGLQEGSKILRTCGTGQPAVTHWEALGHFDGHSLLSLRLETGRTHQIRAHMAHLGHPLAGDDLYGGSLARIRRQALHCAYLELSCRPLDFHRTFRSALPKDLTQAFPWIRDLPQKEFFHEGTCHRSTEPGKLERSAPGQSAL